MATEKTAEVELAEIARVQQTSDYKRRDITGKEFRRFARAYISSPYQGDLALAFTEETIKDVDGLVVSTLVTDPLGTVVATPDDTFPMLDQQTGEPTGEEMSYTEFYRALYSAYRALALARDGR